MWCDKGVLVVKVFVWAHCEYLKAVKSHCPKVCATPILVIRLLKTVFRLPSDCLQTDTQLPPNCRPTATWLPLDCFLTVFWLSTDYLQTDSRLPPDYLLTALWLPFDCLLTTVNPLDQLALTRLSGVAHRSALLCGAPFIWRTPRGASSVPTSFSCYEYSECAHHPTAISNWILNSSFC